MSLTQVSAPIKRYDPWPRERQGFEDTHQVAYAKHALTPAWRRKPLVFMEQRLGRLLASGSVGWAGWLALHQHASMFGEEMLLRQPLELGALGLLLWLHGKRRARPN